MPDRFCSCGHAHRQHEIRSGGLFGCYIAGCLCIDFAEREWWRAEGYLYGRELGDGLWICVAPMIFTTRLMLCTTGYVMDFYCYERSADAMAAAAVWDGRSEPLKGWVKAHTRDHGERRADA